MDNIKALYFAAEERAKHHFNRCKGAWELYQAGKISKRRATKSFNYHYGKEIAADNEMTKYFSLLTQNKK